ncbi:hypothetical protein [Streptomyces lonarensis]|uniref:Uncharacterized protein n=1 Tax=Streptomyces lonarensis TaxID=700599 RepID=A0A7X6CWU6_9ACTN|nr:hypothetical protein [Streptomyces lonarensis]NJQ04042.1 hypothetical protein [Streptomyces lonarensis]
MNPLPDWATLGLYALSALCGLSLIAVWLLGIRDRRNAGFATKRLLRRHMSARAVLQAKEIRPSPDRDKPKKK